MRFLQCGNVVKRQFGRSVWYWILLLFRQTMKFGSCQTMICVNFSCLLDLKHFRIPPILFLNIFSWPTCEIFNYLFYIHKFSVDMFEYFRLSNMWQHCKLGGLPKTVICHYAF